MKSVKTLSLAVLAASSVGVLGILATPPAAAQESPRVTASQVPGTMGIPQPEPLITLNVQNASLGRILADVFKQVPYKYQILTKVGAAGFSINAQRQPLTTVLTQILAQDKSQEPLVFRFNRDATGVGSITIVREYIEASEEGGERKLSAAEARVTRVLPEVFKKMGVKHRIEPDVPPVLISLQLRPNEWAQVLPQVLAEAAKQEPTLTYSLDRDTYVVHLQKTPTISPSPGSTMVRRVRVAATATPLRDVLTSVFMGSGWKYQVSDAVKDLPITYTGNNEPELVALHGILRNAAASGEQITYREGRGVLYIEPGPLPGMLVSTAVRPVVGARTNQVTLNVKDMPIRDVVATIIRETGAALELAPTVPNVRVTLRLEGAGIHEAVSALLAAGRVGVPNLGVTPRGTGFVLGLQSNR